MKICMVGEETFGKNHLDRLKNIEDVAVARELGFPLRTLNLDEGLSLHGFEAAILTTPTPIHSQPEALRDFPFE